MKKLSIYLLLLVFAFLPLKAFAAVDITLEDKSTTTQKSVDILVNTGTDTTQKVEFQIQASTDVTISSLSDESTVCSAFNYTNVSNLLTVTCTLTEAKVLNGNVATILFSSTSADYTFMVSKTTGLDLGTLTLGTVTNIAGAEVTTAQPTTTAAPTTTETTTTKSFQDMLTDYLPYILIGGATILLISILGILLSKKKDTKPEEIVTQVEEKKEEIAPAPSDTRPTDIDNISGNLYSPQVKEETIQEKLEEAPVQQQAAEAPSPATESNDLADLMAKESSPVVEETPAFAPASEPIPTETVPPVVEEVTPAPVSDFNPMPTETVAPVVEGTIPTQTPMPDYNSLPTNLPDMQQMVNNGVQETPVAPAEETPTEEPQSVPPVQPTI